MPSQLRSETSRLNGAKSRGPKTGAAKAVSSGSYPTLKELKRTIVIEGENPDRFAGLLAQLRAELHPCGIIEEGFVEDLATFAWRKRRLLSMETASVTRAIRDGYTGPLSEGEFAEAHLPAVRAAIAYTSLGSNTKILELINQQEFRFDRLYNRTLRQFFAFRAARTKEAAK